MKRTIKDEQEILKMIFLRVWQSANKINECTKIMEEHKSEKIEFQGLVYECCLACLEQWNDTDLLTDFNLNIRDPELG
ncbi:hypothetical protein [Tritonibacter mobilis]|uniref:Uncharacterized protein n=2 Tax=Tritonibacter mobilis TaxID=379347 RepID=A0A1B1A9U6_9RHOB|nr:hypothetical protein [Tritonibacter mobilis]ANP43320.1 hypothetical protein K529_021430 [Tritonibacter mobilis F1926]KJZ22264.1 hypothetical protein TW79_18725 [Tritonibacter mobilis]